MTGRSVDADYWHVACEGAVEAADSYDQLLSYCLVSMCGWSRGLERQCVVVICFSGHAREASCGLLRGFTTCG